LCFIFIVAPPLPLTGDGSAAGFAVGAAIPVFPPNLLCDTVLYFIFHLITPSSSLLVSAPPHPFCLFSGTRFHDYHDRHFNWKHPLIVEVVLDFESLICYQLSPPIHQFVKFKVISFVPKSSQVLDNLSPFMEKHNKRN
jgi:hypothetical protein